MIHGHLKAPETYAFLMPNAAWRTAFDWLNNLQPDPPLGIQQLKGEDMYANIMRYNTLPREQCRWESHRQYIDLQYTLAGGEYIDWRWAAELRPEGPFNSTQDLQFYCAADSRTYLHLLPGYFGIFLPADAHRARVSDAINEFAFKLVIKINLKLIA